MDTGTLVSHVTLRLLKPECALDESWCQEELSVAVKRAVTLLHSHTITSRAGKGEPGEGQDRVDRGREAGELCGGLTPILRASRGCSFMHACPQSAALPEAGCGQTWERSDQVFRESEDLLYQEKSHSERGSA